MDGQWPKLLAELARVSAVLDAAGLCHVTRAWPTPRTPMLIAQAW
jgi:hypothetical protein